MNGAGNKRRGRALRPRLEKALELLGSTDVLADIGCDHGYFSLAALRKGCCERIIAADISAPSLAKAEKHAVESGLGSRISFRCGDGLSVLSPGEATAAVLLGMGGELIVSILDAANGTAQGFERIVMQPMRGEAELRGYLIKSGFHIEDEAVVFDAGRYYQLIAARYAPEEANAFPEGWPDGYYQFGACSLEKRDELMLPMMRRYLAIMENKLERAGKSGSVPPSLVREAECTRKLMDLFEQTEE